MNENQIALAKVFVDTLQDLRWQLHNGPDWAHDIESGIDLEAILEREHSDACITFSCSSTHISVLMADKEEKIFWEFGLDYTDAAGLKNILLFLNDKLQKFTYDEFSKWFFGLSSICQNLIWEVQGSPQESMTEHNISSRNYVRPIPML